MLIGVWAGSIAFAGEMETQVEALELMFDAVQAAAPAKRRAAMAEVAASPVFDDDAYLTLEAGLDAELDEAEALFQEIDALLDRLGAADPWLAGDLPERVGRLRSLADRNLADAIGTVLAVDQRAAARVALDSGLCAVFPSASGLDFAPCALAPLAHADRVHARFATWLVVPARANAAYTPALADLDSPGLPVWRGALAGACLARCDAPDAREAAESAWRERERFLRERRAELDSSLALVRSARRATAAEAAWLGVAGALAGFEASEAARLSAGVGQPILASSHLGGEGWVGLAAARALLWTVEGAFVAPAAVRARQERANTLDRATSGAVVGGVQWASGAAAFVAGELWRGRLRGGLSGALGGPGPEVVVHAGWGARAPQDGWSGGRGLWVGARAGAAPDGAVLGLAGGLRLASRTWRPHRPLWAVDGFVDSRAVALERQVVVGARLGVGLITPLR